MFGSGRDGVTQGTEEVRGEKGEEERIGMSQVKEETDETSLQFAIISIESGDHRWSQTAGVSDHTFVFGRLARVPCSWL
jgi:hypothetical protein